MVWKVRARPGARHLVAGRLGQVDVAELDAAGAELVDAGDQVHHRGLAGTVGTDQAGDLAAGDFHVERGHGLQAAEALAHPLENQ